MLPKSHTVRCPLFSAIHKKCRSEFSLFPGKLAHAKSPNAQIQTQSKRAEVRFFILTTSKNEIAFLFLRPRKKSCFLHFRQKAFADSTLSVQSDDAVRKTKRIVQMVRRKQNGHLFFFSEFPQKMEERQNMRDIQKGGRFVQKQELRMGRHRSRHQNPRAFAIRFAKSVSSVFAKASSTASSSLSVRWSKIPEKGIRPREINSRTVMPNGARSWVKTEASNCALFLFAIFSITIPHKRIVPEQGVKSPAKVFKSVLFPEPFGPTSETNSPACKSKDAWGKSGIP